MSELSGITACFMSELSVAPTIFMSEVLNIHSAVSHCRRDCGQARYRFAAATRFTISAMAFHCTSFLERGHEVFTPNSNFHSYSQLGLLSRTGQFNKTNRVWMDVFVRATATVAGGSQLVATAAKMAAPHTGGGPSSTCLFSPLSASCKTTASLP